MQAVDHYRLMDNLIGCLHTTAVRLKAVQKCQTNMPCIEKATELIQLFQILKYYKQHFPQSLTSDHQIILGNTFGRDTCIEWRMGLEVLGQLTRW